jgi:aminopeptidase YwaD
MSIETIREYVHQLATRIGPRPQGSPACRAAAEYIRQSLAQSGMEGEEQRSPCLDWEGGACRLEIGGKLIPAGSNMFSPPCDVTAPLVCVETLEELAEADLEGRICVMHGRLTAAPLSPKAWFLISDEEREVIRRLEAKRPAALVSLQTKPGFLERMTGDAELLIPALTVPAAAAAGLLEGAGETARLVIASRSQPGFSANIVGRKNRQPVRIVLCAHYDTVIDSPGALDNAGGVAVILDLAERLMRQPVGCNLEIVAFSGHESLPLGDDTYLRYEEAGFPDILAAINFDGVGANTGPSTIAFFTESNALRQTVEGIVAGFPGIRRTEPWPQSNHSTFAWRGVPSMAFCTEDAFSLTHLQTDKEEFLRIDKIDEIACATEKIVLALAAQTPAWARKAEPA